MGIPSLGSFLLAGLTLVSATLGYAIYFDYKRRNNPSFRRKVKKDMKKLEQMSTEVSPEPELAHDDSLEHQATDHTHSKLPQFDATNVDLQLEQILMRPGQEREKIFYGLLIKGEELANSGNKQQVERGIQYFYKALCLLPNPTELLTILQNTIPSGVFKQLLQLIGDTSMKRIITYFKSITPEGSAIEIRPSETKIQGQDILMFSVFAAKDFQQEQVIYQESPVMSVMISSNSTNKRCDNCHVLITEEFISCNKCGVEYCSNSCFSVADNTYHRLLCSSESPIQELLDYSIEHPYIILIARYMSTIFLEQLRAVKSISQGIVYDATNSVVSHFEYMRYYGQVSSSIDEKEAAMIQRVFKGHVQELEDSLSVERYAAVKYRLLSTCVPLHPHSPTSSMSLHQITTDENTESTIEKKTEYPDIPPQCIALLKCSGHIEQNKEPNVKLFTSGHDMVSIVASRNISKGDELTLPYFSLPNILAKERCLDLVS